MTPQFICSAPECNVRMPEPGRCFTHRRRDNRPSAYHRGYDHKWRAFRADYLKTHSLCEGIGGTEADATLGVVEAMGGEVHANGCDGRATEAHHVDGKGPLGPRGYDPTNLRPLSAECHKAITAQEQPGGWAA